MVKLSDLRKKYKDKYKNIFDIDIIIMDILKIDRSKLFFDIPISQKQEKQIDESILRLSNGEPVNYITGHKEFMSLDFCVNNSTLIPRQDTEILVEQVIDFYKNKKPPFIFEIGTGSGCIAISLANYIKDCHITACDVSDFALETAKLNAQRNNVSEKINFIKKDIMTGFPSLHSPIDCIVSNPPYIESNTIQNLEPIVKDFEPITALDGGLDGLDFYRQIILCNNLKSGGLLAFEIGYNQAAAVTELMNTEFTNIKIIKDLSGNDRVVTGIKK